MLLFQPAKPRLANEFAVGRLGVDPGGGHHLEDAFHQGDTLRRIGIALLVQQRPK